MRWVNTLTKREISTFLLNMCCERAVVFTFKADLSIELISTSRARLWLIVVKKREKQGLI